MTEVLAVGLASWIIQDGNYPDFAVGQERAFALEFYAQDPLRPVKDTQVSEPRHIHIADATFDVVGRSLRSEERWWAVDFGVPAYTFYPPKGAHQSGALFQGRISLGIDHFAYFESIAHSPNAPALIFDWKIERIEMQTAPFIKIPGGPFIRDPRKIGWRDVDETDAWKDDSGHAEYILHCQRIAGQPRRTLKR